MDVWYHRRMPTNHVVCGVPYRRYEDGRISVIQGEQERFLVLDKNRSAIMSQNWQKYGGIITRLAKEFKVPVAYIIGFLTIESGGNENACAPCSRTIVDSSGVEQQWCSVAPNCAPPGHKQCCAYGLLQVIHSNVSRLSGGKHSGQDLLGNPELSIRYGIMIFLENWTRYGDVLTAVKRYNGGTPCQGGGVFRMGGQVGSNYVDQFVQACNSFVEMSKSLGIDDSSSPVGAYQSILVTAGMAVVSWLLITRTATGREVIKLVSSRLG